MHKTNRKKKEIRGRSEKQCVVCGKSIHVVHYTNQTYRGGHYLGKFPLHRGKDLKEALKAGTQKIKMEGEV